MKTQPQEGQSGSFYVYVVLAFSNFACVGASLLVHNSVGSVLLNLAVGGLMSACAYSHYDNLNPR